MSFLPDHTIKAIVFSATDAAIIKDKKLFEALSAYINQLINNDFEYLLSLLYRIDVDEKKMRALLHQQQNSNAADIIARLIIARQLEKIKCREQFKPPTIIPEEEKW